MTHALLNEAIRTDWKNIQGFLPCRTATSVKYAAYKTKALAWNEGEGKTKIDLPLRDGWYVPDGNPFAIPNGRESSREDPEAIYLVRHQDSAFSGPLGRGCGAEVKGRGVLASVGWSNASGVALVDRDVTALLVAVPADKLVEIQDPKALLQRVEQLEAMAEDFRQRFGGMDTAETFRMHVTEPLETAKMLRELAGKIEAIPK